MENKTWQDSVRLKMIEKSEFYSEPRVYQYGYYDGYQLRSEQIEKLEAENKTLHEWKESASNVMSEMQLQEIGKALNLKLGSSITKQILPSILQIQADKEELLEALEEYLRLRQLGKNDWKEAINGFAKLDLEIESLIQKHKQ